MNEYKLQQLKEQRKEISELLNLFNRAAFRPYDKNNGGDPTAALNGIHETRVALQKGKATLIQDKNVAEFFRKLEDQLLEIENKVQMQYPQVTYVAAEWQGKPLNTAERIASIRQKLGEAYEKAAIFIRAEAYSVYDSPEKARTVLEELDKKIDQLINGKDTTVTKKIGIAFLATDFTNSYQLRFQEEFGEMDEQLRPYDNQGVFKLEVPRFALRPEDITGALTDFQPKIVHFSGHGTPDGALCFKNKAGQTHLIQPEALADLFKKFKKVNCIVLNACYSQLQAEAISKHIKYVIGMNNAISDKAAIAFTTGFYQALRAGDTITGNIIKRAYEMGRTQIRLQRTPEPLTPGIGRGLGFEGQELPGIDESETPVLIIKGQLQQ